MLSDLGRPPVPGPGACHVALSGQGHAIAAAAPGCKFRQYILNSALATHDTGRRAGLRLGL